jgi:hypothetical protein
MTVRDNPLDQTGFRCVSFERFGPANSPAKMHQSTCLAFNTMRFQNKLDQHQDVSILGDFGQDSRLVVTLYSNRFFRTFGAASNKKAPN